MRGRYLRYANPANHDYERHQLAMLFKKV